MPDKFLTLHGAAINNKLKDVKIPVNKNGTMFINWAGRWVDTFSHLSASEVYRLFYLKESLSNTQSDSALPTDEMKQIDLNARAWK